MHGGGGGGGEVIQIGLGSSANALLVHWSNLQGLQDNRNDNNDPRNITTTTTTHQQLQVPRVLWVSSSSDGATTPLPTPTTGGDVDETAMMNSAWDGRVETISSHYDDSADATGVSPTTTTSPPEDDVFSKLRQQALAEASSAYSRYRIDHGVVVSHDGRTVDWDALEDKEDEDDTVRQHKHQQWLRRHAEMQVPLNAYWTSTDHSTKSWRDYLLAPYHPRSILSVPSISATSWFTDDATTLDQLEDRIRWLLEDCERCQGIILAVDPTSIQDSWATHCLQYLEDEAATARRWTLPCFVMDPVNDENLDWRSRQIQTLRHSIQTGLALQSQTQSSHVWMPLCHEQDMTVAAASLETVSLLYRSRSHGGSRFEWNSVITRSTTLPLSMAEFCQSLQPTPQHNIVQLNTMIPPNHGDKLFPALRVGTSIERRQQQYSHHNAELPGRWLLEPDQGGLLQSLSLAHPEDRSHHSHFALSTSIRVDSNSRRHNHPDDLVTCLMEGMGIRYHPEQCLGYVHEQGLTELVRDGYGAGSYWPYVWNHNRGGDTVVSVLENSTRMYPYLQHSTDAMAKALSPRCRDYWNRDVASGIVPEWDDCQEALTQCYNLQDLYRPPEGSGLYNDTKSSDWDG